MKEFNASKNISINEQEDSFPLHQAVIDGNDLLVEKALSSGESITVKDNSGYTPIYYSIERKDKSLFKFLLYFKGSHIAARLDFENAIKRQDDGRYSYLSFLYERM